MYRTIANRKPFEVSFIESRTNVLNRDYFVNTEPFKQELYSNSIAKNFDYRKAGSIKDFGRKLREGFKKVGRFVRDKAKPIVDKTSKIVNKVAKSNMVKQLASLHPKASQARDWIEKGTDRYNEYSEMLDKIISKKKLEDKDKQKIVRDLSTVINIVKDKAKRKKDVDEVVENAKLVAENIDKAIAENPQDKEELVKSAGLIALVNRDKIIRKENKSGRITLSGMIIPQNRWVILGKTGVKPRLPKSAGRIFLGSPRSMPSAGYPKSKAQEKLEALRKRMQK